MKFNKELFEVSRTHLPMSEPIAERCDDAKCSNRHFWSVYSVQIDGGMSEWLSDHINEELAQRAAASYEPGFSDTFSLCVLAVGNAFDGISLHGPFPRKGPAIEYANGFNSDWHVIEVTKAEQ